MLHGMRWKAVWSLFLFLFMASVNGSIFGRRGLLGSERCVTFQSSCLTYILNIAIAYRIEGSKFRVQGWINLGPGETSEVCWDSVGDDAWVLVNKPNDDIGCFIDPISQRGPFEERREFCINSDGWFDIRQSLGRRSPEFYFGLSDEGWPDCAAFAPCYGMMPFEKFEAGPRHGNRPELLTCP